jgi:hypothetical protein
MNANTRVEFEENRTALIEAFSDQQELLSYLEQYQLVHREHFVKAWIKQHRYYGVTSTSPLECYQSSILALEMAYRWPRHAHPTEFSQDISRSCLRGLMKALPRMLYLR